MSYSVRRENIGRDINTELDPPALNPGFSPIVNNGLCNILVPKPYPVVASNKNVSW